MRKNAEQSSRILAGVHGLCVFCFRLPVFSLSLRTYSFKPVLQPSPSFRGPQQRIYLVHLKRCWFGLPWVSFISLYYTWDLMSVTAFNFCFFFFFPRTQEATNIYEGCLIDRKRELCWAKRGRHWGGPAYHRRQRGNAGDEKSENRPCRWSF